MNPSGDREAVSLFRHIQFGLIGVLLVAVVGPVEQSHAQEAPPPVFVEKVPQRAFGMSLVLPGWGHRYAQNGSWRGRATFFALAEAALWVGILQSNRRQDHLVQSFETLAAARAGADITGKDRTFFLNLATYRSSDEFLTLQLRNRAWDQIDYVSDPAFQWDWQSEADFAKFRDLRDDSESFRRRRPVLVALLVANRLVAGISAIRAVNKANALEPEVALTAAPASAYTNNPMLHLRWAW